MIKSKGLGRGLDALLSGGKPETGKSEGQLREVLVGDLTPGKYQPRTKMNQAALEELAQGCREAGR